MFWRVRARKYCFCNDVIRLEYQENKRTTGKTNSPLCSGEWNILSHLSTRAELRGRPGWCGKGAVWRDTCCIIVNTKNAHNHNLREMRQLFNSAVTSSKTWSSDTWFAAAAFLTQGPMCACRLFYRALTVGPALPIEGTCIYSGTS